MKKAAYAGTHMIADFWFGKIIKEKRDLVKLLQGAAKAAASTPLEISVHKFSPQGITGVILLAESHIAFHTWPEIHYTAIDIFTCGKKAKPKNALRYLKDALKPRYAKMQTMKRGKL